MRTTLDLDEDILLVAKELARRERSSAGAVISRLVRQQLTSSPLPAGSRAKAPAAVGGFRPFASRGIVVTDENIDALRDAEGI